MDNVIVLAKCGQVMGKRTELGYTFLNIPFAEAERFRAPKPVKWEGVKECLEYGAPAPQGRRLPGKPFEVTGNEETCLNLNIWTKSIDENAKLPTVVYIYGGAFQSGSNSDPAHAGDLFMENDAMTYVALNYRVGLFGFLELGDIYDGVYRGSGNCGIYDLLEGLRWVKENISAFGGDPEKIILLGISAGAKAIGTLITLPEVQQMCHWIIVESGAIQAFRTYETALAVRDRYMSYLPEGANLLAMTTKELAEAQADFIDCEGSTCFYGPVLEAPFDPDWKTNWANGARFTGRAILGSGRHELCRMVYAEGFSDKAATIAMDMFGDNGRLAIEKQKALAAETGDYLAAWESVFSDFMYRFYTDDLSKKLEDEGNLVWNYSFEFPPAGHGQGFAFLQNRFGPPGGTVSDKQLAVMKPVADVFRKLVRGFIMNDEPDEMWQTYNGGNKMIIDAAPHMEYRPNDTVSGFPDEVFSLSGK